MPGSRDFVSFFRPGGRTFALKSCPRGGDLTKKISGRGGGGMVTGQIDTCISGEKVLANRSIVLGNINVFLVAMMFYPQPLPCDFLQCDVICGLIYGC